MSRAIQIRVSESVSRTVHVEDGVESPLELLPILPPVRMGEILATELTARGFVREGNVCTRTDADGLEISIDLEKATISVKLGASNQIAESIEITRAAAEEHRKRAEQLAQVELEREIEARVALRTDALRREVTARLEKKLADVRAELDAAVGAATIAALTERAGQLGEVASVVGDDAGNVTIRVKL